MIDADKFIFPLTNWSKFIGSFPKTINNLCLAMKCQNYQQIINDSTMMIDSILLQQNIILLALYETRAYAYAMQNRFDLALADGEQIVKHAPTTALSYIYKANALSMNDHQNQAIRVYDQGLKLVQLDQNKENEIEAALKIGKEMATKQYQKKFDPVKLLPVEITNQIFSLLPQYTRTTCLQISKAWSEQIQDCADVWRSLVILDEKRDLQIVRVTPRIGNHVKHFTIYTTTSSKMTLFNTYVELLTEGHFMRIQSININVRGNYNAEKYFSPLSTVIWKIRNTLTRLNIDSDSIRLVIPIADVLSVCSNLVEFIYSTRDSLSRQAKSLAQLKDHECLNDFQLKAARVIGGDVDPILKHCPQLQRFVLNGSVDYSFLDTIAKHTLPNLVVLGYNPNMIPDFPPSKNIVVSSLEKERNMAGNLRVFYTNDGGPTSAIQKILPILYKNMDTLEDVVVCCIPPRTQPEIQQLYTQYHDFRLPNIRCFQAWLFKGTQDFILQAISNSTKLTNLTVNAVHDMNGLVNTLMDMHPLSYIFISHPEGKTTSLCHLFKRYAELSTSINTISTTRKQQRPVKLLETITLNRTGDFSDDLLSTLADIKTLRRVDLQRLPSISADGIKHFLRKLSHQLTCVRIENIPSVKDDVIASLADIDNLEVVILRELDTITDWSAYSC
ncbi:hypothetical protein BDA99DRAFT_507748, partial [Phascolomyces articulosus]